MRWTSFLILLLLTPAALPQLRAQCPTLVWSDEFEGSAVDPARWEAQLGNGCSIGLCGWGNQELQSYRAENATVNGGTLKITARQEQASDGSRYTSSRLRTRGLGDWTFGRFEARIRLPEGQGAWPAFWMLSTDEVYGVWPQSGEIDIMESRGLVPGITLGTIHFGDPVPNNRSVGGQFTSLEEPLSDGFHLYAVEWEPDQIRWFLDGALFAVRTPDDLRGNRWPFDQRFHLLLNLAVGGTFPGPPDPADFPAVLEVDFVRVYDRSAARLEGEFQLPILASEVSYRVVNAPEAGNFRWSVPPQARLVTGQGTDTITVDWEQSGGTVGVEFDSACGPQRLELEVSIRAPDLIDRVVEDFEGPEPLEVLFASGQYQAEAANPAPSGLNPSDTVARYQRNAGDKFDVILYRTSDFADAAEYVQGRRRLYLDVYTGADPGTEMVLQFEADGRTSPTNFPRGRHSTYTARTTVRNQWERLEFEFSARLDGDTPDDAIDNLVLLTDPGWNSGDTWFFDNLASAVVDGVRPGAPANLRLESIDTDRLLLAWDAASDNLGVAGYLVFANGVQAGQTDQTSFELSGLTPATSYRLNVATRDLAGNRSQPSTVLEVVTPAANAVVNGGFEDGGTAPWVGGALTGGPTRSGSFALQVGPEGAGQRVEGLEPDTEYRLSAWLAAEAGSAVSLGADGFGGRVESRPAGSREFEQVTVTFRTGPGVRTARIFVNLHPQRQSRGWNRRQPLAGYADDFELIPAGN